MSTVKQEIYSLSNIVEKGIIEKSQLPQKYRKYITKSTRENIFKNIIKLNNFVSKGERNENTRGLLVHLCNMQFEYILTLIRIHLENQDIYIEGKTSDELLKLFTKNCVILDYNGANATRELSNFIYSYKNARNKAIHVGQYIEKDKSLVQDNFIDYACRKEQTSLMLLDDSYSQFLIKYKIAMKSISPSVINKDGSEVVEYLKVLRCIDLLLKDIKTIKDSVVQDYVDYMFVKLAYLKANLAKGYIEINDEDSFTYDVYKHRKENGFGKIVEEELIKLKKVTNFG